MYNTLINTKSQYYVYVIIITNDRKSLVNISFSKADNGDECTENKC